MTKNNGINITKPEIKFWMAIISAIMVGVIAFVRLDSKVEAMVSREQVNKAQFFKVVETVDKLLHNQIIIGTKLGIEGLME